MGARSDDLTSTGDYNGQIRALRTDSVMLNSIHLEDKSGSIPSNAGYAQIGILENGDTIDYIVATLAQGIIDSQHSVSWSGIHVLTNETRLFARIWIPTDTLVRLSWNAFRLIMDGKRISGIDP